MVSTEPDTPNIRLVIADANPASLAGMRAALADERFELLAEATSADGLVEAAGRERPDVCLVDAALPGGAVAATARITRELPGSAVVLLARRTDDTQMFEAVRAGAAGYLLKSMDPERLRFAIRGVTEGEAALPRKLVARLMAEFRSGGRTVVTDSGLRVNLTSREWAAALLLAEGSTTSDIARSLQVSEVTVRRHISTAAAKLDVRGRDALVEAIRHSGRS